MRKSLKLTETVRMNRRLILSAIVLVLAAAGAVAQDALHVFVERLGSAPAAFEYSFASHGGNAPLAGSGRASIAGDCYRIVGDGLDIRCDGSARWTADPAAGEMVIEPVDSHTLDFVSNPVMIFRDLDTCFSSEEVSRGVFVLTPHCSDNGIDKLSISFSSNGAPCAAKLFMSDGSVADFTISGFVFGAPGEPYSFSKTDLKAYRNVTDLR